MSHSQANGFIILVPLLGIIVLSGPMWHWYISTKSEDRTRDLAMLDSLVALWESPNLVGAIDPPDSVTAAFRFDPNHATLQELQALGFHPALATRIDRYRQKGGRFFAKRDLLKIYGIDSSLYNRLYAFIDLPETSQVERTRNKKKSFERKNIPANNGLSKFDINKADTLQLMRVEGIGTKRSQRIVNYRNALGGFISMDQIQEVFGLDSVVVHKLLDATFIAEDFEQVTMNINTSDEKRLAAHPYLSNAAARSIVAYRFQHGDFKTIGDLRNIHVLDEKTIQKIAPYLRLGD